MKLHTFYRLTARCYVVLIVLSFAIGVAALVTGKFGDMSSGKMLDMPPAIAIPMGALGALCAVLTIPFWLGMVWDCIFQSRLPLLAKALWIVVMLLTFIMAALVYYFVVLEKRSSRGAAHGPMVLR